MKNLICCLPFLFIHLLSIYAQIIPGARQIALANTDVALNNNVFSLFSNPGCLADIADTEIGIFYSPSPFGLKQLSNGAAAAAKSSKIGSFALGITVFGFELYKEYNFSAGYSFKMNSRFSMGISLLFHFLKIARYGSDSQININFGGILNISKNFNLGFTLHNPLRYSDSSILLPLYYEIGLSYEITNSAAVTASLLKEINFPVSAGIGMNYQLSSIISIQFGVRNKPNIYSGGLTIEYGILGFSYSVSSHNLLGLSHQGEMIFHL